MKLFFALGSFNMFLAVALGAFGAHGLKQRVAAELLTTWNTAVLYHLIHALALLLFAVIGQLFPGVDLVKSAGWGLLSGILLFSGSLYLLVLTAYKPLGMITPLGGVAFLCGWLMLLAASIRHF